MRLRDCLALFKKHSPLRKRCVGYYDLKKPFDIWHVDETFFTIGKQCLIINT